MTELDPSIILRAGDAAARLPRYGDVMEQRAQVQLRNLAQLRQQRADEQAEAAQQREQQMLDRRQQAGQMASQGDYEGSEKLMLENGDFDWLGHISKFKDDEREQHTRQIRAIAPVAIAALELPDLAARQALVLSPQSLAQFAESGMDEAEVRKFVADPNNLSDQALGQMVSRARGFEGAIKQYDEANKPYTLGVDQVRFDGSGKEVARGPAGMQGFAPTANVYQRGGGGQSGGASVDRMLPAIVAQESGGNYSARNAGSGALGAYQVMPATGQTLAGRLGLPWRPDLMTSSTPEGKQYQDQIGQAAVKEAVDNSGGDPAMAAAYYHGGPDRSKWGPKTQKYIKEVTARLGQGGPQQIQQGGQKPPTWRTLPTEEAAQRGLPEGIWQENANGQIKPVSGTAGKPVKGSKAYSQSALDAFDRAIDSANRLLKHPGASAAIGSGFDPQSWGSINPITGKAFGGTEAANFGAELDALKAQVFLPMVQSMKGMGALSNAEGQKLTDAIGAMDANMSEKAFKASLARIITDLKTYRDREGKVAQTAPQGNKTTSKPSVSNW